VTKSQTYLINSASLSDGSTVNLAIAAGKIREISQAELNHDGEETVIDATGLLLLPGFVDLHTHLREPGRENSETVLTGSQAAVLGGFTAITAMANTNPVADSAGVVEQVARLGREAGICDVFPIGAVSVGLRAKLWRNYLPWLNRRPGFAFLVMMAIA